MDTSTKVLLGVVFATGGALTYAVVTRTTDAEESNQLAEDEHVEKTNNRREKDRSGPRSDSARPNADLEQRVAALETQVATMRRHLALPGGPRATLSDLDNNDPDAVAAPLEHPEFDSTVRDIVADERQREQDQRWERRSQRSMEQLTEAASLRPEQQTAIAALWDTERERLTPLFVAARSGDKDFDEVIKDVEAVRAETDAEAKKVLSEDQLAAYEENRPRGPGGRGRGGDGGNGRGGGRGGQ